MYGCVCTCVQMLVEVGLRLILGIILNSSPTLCIEVECLHQTQSLPILPVSLASLVRGVLWDDCNFLREVKYTLGGLEEQGKSLKN